MAGKRRGGQGPARPYHAALCRERAWPKACKDGLESERDRFPLLGHLPARAAQSHALRRLIHNQTKSHASRNKQEINTCASAFCSRRPPRFLCRSSHTGSSFPAACSGGEQHAWLSGCETPSPFHAPQKEQEPTVLTSPSELALHTHTRVHAASVYYGTWN